LLRTVTLFYHVANEYTQMLMKFTGMMLVRTNNFVQSITLLKCIWEVLGSNVGEILTFLACFWCEILGSHSGEFI